MQARKPTRLFHYTHSEDIAKRIANEGRLIPSAPDVPSGIGTSRTYCEPRVNLTSILPERGREQVREGTGMIVAPNYALELIIDQDAYRISRAFFEPYPDIFVIFSDEPVEAVVKNIWNVERNHRRASRGGQVERHGAPFNYFSRFA